MLRTLARPASTFVRCSRVSTRQAAWSPSALPVSALRQTRFASSESTLLHVQLYRLSLSSRGALSLPIERARREFPGYPSTLGFHMTSSSSCPSTSSH